MAIKIVKVLLEQYSKGFITVYAMDTALPIAVGKEAVQQLSGEFKKVGELEFRREVKLGPGSYVIKVKYKIDKWGRILIEERSLAYIYDMFEIKYSSFGIDIVDINKETSRGEISVNIMFLELYMSLIGDDRPRLVLDSSVNLVNFARTAPIEEVGDNYVLIASITHTLTWLTMGKYQFIIPKDFSGVTVNLLSKDILFRVLDVLDLFKEAQKNDKLDQEILEVVKQRTKGGVANV
jgi:hypothetical protein